MKFDSGWASRGAVGASVALFFLIAGFVRADLCREDFARVFRRLAPKVLPTQLEVRALLLNPLRGADLRRASRGETVRYVVDQDDRLWILPPGETLSPNRVTLVVSESSQAAPRLIKEAGHLAYDPKTRQFTLRTETEIGLTEEEMARSLAGARTSSGQQALVRDAGRTTERARVVSCLESASLQAGGQGFVGAQILGGNAVMGFSMLLSEVSGANRLGTSQGADVLKADWINGNVASAVYGLLGTYALKRNLGVGSDLLLRTGVGLGLTLGQNGVYRAMLPDDHAAEHANKITFFDLGYTVARAPINLGVDHVMLNRVPEWFAAACARDSSARLILHPTTIRLLERLGSSVLYYQVRKAVINE